MTKGQAIDKLDNAIGHLGREGNATLADAQATDILIEAQEQLLMGKAYKPYSGSYTAEAFHREGIPAGNWRKNG